VQSLIDGWNREPLEPLQDGEEVSSKGTALIKGGTPTKLVKP